MFDELWARKALDSNSKFPCCSLFSQRAFAANMGEMLLLVQAKRKCINLFNQNKSATGAISATLRKYHIYLANVVLLCHCVIVFYCLVYQYIQYIPIPNLWVYLYILQPDAIIIFYQRTLLLYPSTLLGSNMKLSIAWIHIPTYPTWLHAPSNRSCVPFLLLPTLIFHWWFLRKSRNILHSLFGKRSFWSVVSSRNKTYVLTDHPMLS